MSRAVPNPHDHTEAVRCANRIVEYDEAEAAKIPALDRIGRDPRRFYFVRRTLATFTEIPGAVNQLNSNPELKRFRRRFDKETLQMWDKTVKVVRREPAFSRGVAQRRRRALLDKAADYAVGNIHDTTVGAIELVRIGKGAEAKMPFAYVSPLM